MSRVYLTVRILRLDTCRECRRRSRPRHEKFAAHDQTDFEGLGEITARLRAVEDEVDELELRWLELSESLEG